MQIQYKGTNYDIPEEVIAESSKKLLRLEKYLGEQKETAYAQVELGRDAAHQSGDVWRAEVNLTVEGELYRAEASRDTLGNAVDAVEAQLGKRLRRSRKKDRALFRRGASAIKSMFRRP